MRTILGLVIFGVVFVAPVSAAEKKSNFVRIKAGMTVEKVKRLVGEPDYKLSKVFSPESDQLVFGHFRKHTFPKSAKLEQWQYRDETGRMLIVWIGEHPSRYIERSVVYLAIPYDAPTTNTKG